MDWIFGIMVDADQKPGFSLIIPAYRAASFLERHVTAVVEYFQKRAYLPKENEFANGESPSPQPSPQEGEGVHRKPNAFGYAFEVVVVNDGGEDQTDEILSRLAQKYPGVVLKCSYRPNRGKGYALREGISAARHESVVFTDADLAYPLPEVERVVRRLVEGAALVIANRTLGASRVVAPPSLWFSIGKRKMASIGLNFFIRRLFHVPFRDTQAGLKGFRRSWFLSWASSLKSYRFTFDVELLVRAERQGVGVEELPVCLFLLERGSTAHSLRAGLAFFKDLWTLRYSMF